MAIRFMIGRAGSGKSETMLREVRDRLRQEPDGSPLILLVPEQATFQMEHALVSTPGLHGIIRAQVLSFRRLAWRVMQETGETAGIPIDDTGKAMLLARIIHRHQAELRLFPGGAGQLGLIGGLHSLFSEWKRYCVSAELLERHVAGQQELLAGEPLLADKLRDLQLIFHEYEQELATQYLDGEDYLTHLADKLGECSFVREAEIWIDGFFGFTPQEQAAVVQLVRHARAVSVALCLDRPYTAGERPHELNLFHPTAMTMIRLQEKMAELGLASAACVQLDGGAPPRFAHSSQLAHLERQFDRRLSPRRERLAVIAGESCDIVVCQAVHRRAEVEGTAREMIRLVREEGVRWREMAVRVRDMETYGDLLAAIFSDYGIPCFFDQKRAMLHHPLIEFIRSALEVVLHGWPYEAVFRCVKTDFFLPLESEANIFDGTVQEAYAQGPGQYAMDELENYVLAFGINGSRWLNSRSFELHRTSTLDDGDQSADEPADAAYTERILASRKAVVEPLLGFQESIRRAKRTEDMTAALFALLEQLQVPERLRLRSEAYRQAGQPEKARENSQVWERVIDVLDQLVTIVGNEEMPLALYAKLLDAGFEQIRLGLVPPALDQVLIGSIDRTRSTQVKFAFVMGVGDGVLPARPVEDGTLSEKERGLLLATGLPMADGSRRKLLDEQFLAYTVLCAPSERLWLSYPLADEEGKALHPSELIPQLLGLFPGLPVRQLLAEPDMYMPAEETAAFLSRAERALASLSGQLKQAIKGEKVQALWLDAYDWFAVRPKWRPRLERMAQALFFANREKPLTRKTSLELYGQHVRASVSRMERFVACPFSQFASHGLRLQERRIYRLEAPDIGQLFHAALKQFVEDMYRDYNEFVQLVPVAIEERAAVIVDRLSPRLQSEILLSSARYRYVARRLKRVVGRAAVMLTEHARRGAFMPVGLELGFGPGEPLPPLLYRLAEGRTMELAGRIDRVDRAVTLQGTLLRVIDYKSSRTTLPLTELYYGLSLQMLAYLDVLLTHAPAWLGEPALPAGVLYFHVHNPLVQSQNALPPDAVERELRKQFKMKGLLRADAETVQLMDAGLIGRSGHSELVDAALTKEGKFYKVSPVVSDVGWDGLREYVRQIVWEIGTELTQGNVAIFPYQIGSEKACDHCVFKPVCHIDPLLADNGFHVLQPRAKEEILQAMELLGEGKREVSAAAGPAEARQICVPDGKPDEAAPASAPVEWIDYGGSLNRTGLRVNSERGERRDGNARNDDAAGRQ